MKALLIACFCLSTLLPADARPKTAPEKLIFTNVNVVNTRDGGIEQGVTVVITKDRITGVGKVGFVAEGRNIKVINANGKYLIAGLWDMHVHSAFVSPEWDEKVIYPLYVANGVTGVRDMGGDPDLLERRRQRVEDGALPSPRILFASQFLSGGESNTQTAAVKSPAEGARGNRTTETAQG